MLHFLVSGVWKWLSWILCFRVTHKAAVKLLAKAGVSSESMNDDKSASKLIGLLAEFNTLSVAELRLSFQLTFDLISLSPCLVGFCHIESCLIKMYITLVGNRDSASIIGITILRLIMEITFYHICHILLGTRMLLDHIAGEKTKQEHKYQEVEIIEVEHPRICLP